ncbi:hypothetical protein PIB30_064599 [Stylosanthes scabra]|uniref:Uncharacterized protein n=1 Tax=Stylosanthes scabra TaxID=79078 RepID=A0ABU6ZKH9_9FABA|nr:hypothetical protein [Stylosanthes scabra]
MDRFKPEVATSDMTEFSLLPFFHLPHRWSSLLVEAVLAFFSILCPGTLLCSNAQPRCLLCRKPWPLGVSVLVRLLSRSLENVTSGLMLCSSVVSCLQRYVLFLT